MEPASGDKLAKLLIDVFLCDPEGLGHVAQGEAAVGLQQLGIRLDLHLPDVELVVREQVAVSLHQLLHLAKFLKTVLI